MVHISPDFPTKKAFKEAIAAGKSVYIYQPGGLFPTPQNGTVTIEAPANYHKWYCRAEVKDTKVIRVIS